MSSLRAGLYACSPEALASIVDHALDRLAEHIDNPAASRDRITLALELVGIELGEIRHAAAAEKRANEQKLRAAHEEIERLRMQLDLARRAA